ncbi:hypothetical protein K9M59_01215 [Candidatus Gracilibacteria bacterium]|nr:hypothetical protein [Candidatus Gracilibacteria bacterium]MCF7819187.1 hypothetical protein [Candidatus Gracilibacteria bacterium]
MREYEIICDEIEKIIEEKKTDLDKIGQYEKALENLNIFRELSIELSSSRNGQKEKGGYFYFDELFTRDPELVVDSVRRRGRCEYLVLKSKNLNTCFRPLGRIFVYFDIQMDCRNIVLFRIQHLSINF